ncbi:MAG: hypothetical protein PF495_06405, partial [Spirochaetales bacterium]|nr:hypothetical protein [Spirochaetales bacterium]
IAMKKTKIFFVLVTIVFTMANCLIAQSPDMFNYQAVARDASKNPIINTSLSIGITIRQAAPDGPELSNTRLISVPYSSFANTAANVINSTDFVRYNDTIYYIEGNVGIGTADPRSTLSVFGTTPNDSAIFEVKNNAGLTLFGVYNDGVRIVIDESAGTKGSKGGFAIGGFDGTKAAIQDYLTVNADSTRIYVKQSGKGPKGGFAIGGFDDTKKGVLDNFVDLTPENYLIGHESGKNITSGLYNSFIGYQSGMADTSGSYNVFLGYQAGMNIEGNWNTFVGHRSGITLTGGYGNTFLGKNTGESRTTGMYNVLIGVNAGKTASTTNYNVIVGSDAAQAALGTGNTFIGHAAGYDATGDNNVFVGYNAGYHETGSDRLYIANSDASSANALIYGVFINSILQINGQVGIGGAYSPDRQLQVHGDIAVTGGSFIDDGTVISDYVFNEDYRLMTIREHADLMWKNRHLPALNSAGELEAAGGYDMSLRREQILEELEIAHIYIEQLNNRIETLEKENIELKKSQELILRKITELKNN